VRKILQIAKGQKSGGKFPESFPRAHKISAARAVAHGRRLGAVGGKPPRMRGAAAAAPQ